MMNQSRHPTIHYWFWKDETFKDQAYLKTLERIAADGHFDTLTLTDRGSDFWDPIHKEDFRTLVTRAHELGLKIVLQLWPRGSVDSGTLFLDKSEAGAIALEVETVVENGTATIRSRDKWTRGGAGAAPIDSELLLAYAFKKTADGYYEPGTLVDVTDRLCIVHRTPNRISATLSLPEYEGYTVYAVAAHYHRIHDVFNKAMVESYKQFIDYYADVPFDGFALDEFKGLLTVAEFIINEPFRGRIWGDAFERVFRERTGKELRRVLLDMRYCPEGEDDVRASAINLYFDVWRRGTTITEQFVYDYTKTVFGEDAFVGFHNTFHNNLCNDEVWNTGCSWWEVKRDYAQTDESTVFPVRMGLACQAKESIVYDMYYHTDKTTFFAKAIRDAAFGSRIHYHAIDDGSRWGIDTGTQEFLDEIAPYEDNVGLLNRFDPPMPVLPLLCVFGFPAQLNWYPNEDARAQFDVTKGLGILEKTDLLWRLGYYNALAPDDALADGRITLGADGRYDYCGHKFEALLFLYPEYAKPETVAFLKRALAQNAKLRVIGALTHGFDGKPLDSRFLADVTRSRADQVVEGALSQLLQSGTPISPASYLSAISDADVALLRQVVCEMGVAQNDIPHGCRLTDGSVVISHYESLRDSEPFTADFALDGARFEATFMGCFALKTNGRGEVEKLVCGHLCSLTRDGQVILPDVRGKLVCYGV